MIKGEKIETTWGEFKEWFETQRNADANTAIYGTKVRDDDPSGRVQFTFMAHRYPIPTYTRHPWVAYMSDQIKVLAKLQRDAMRFEEVYADLKVNGCKIAEEPKESIDIQSLSDELYSLSNTVIGYKKEIEQLRHIAARLRELSEELGK